MQEETKESAHGCEKRVASDITAGIEHAGFQIEMCERFPFSPASFLPPDPHILGTAGRTSQSRA